MDVKHLEEHIRSGMHKALESIQNIGHATEIQLKDTYPASEILLSLTKGEAVSDEQIVFMKAQSVNLEKALALVGLQAVPGSSVAIILLEKVAGKHGFTLFHVGCRSLKCPEKRETN